MELCKEPKEDVDAFSSKVEDKCRRIDGTGRPPSDLNTITAARYMQTTVAEFKSWAYSKFSACNSLSVPAAQKPTWESIITDAKAQYQDLKDNDLWGPARQHAEDGIKALQAEVKSLRRVMDSKSGTSGGGNGGRGGGGGNRPETRECYKCHQKGHIAKDCPQNKDDSKSDVSPSDPNKSPSLAQQRKTPPKDGESHEKTIGDKLHKWCGKCRFWRHGPNAHLTDDHKSKSSEDGSSSGSSGSGSMNLATGHLTFAGIGRASNT